MKRILFVLFPIAFANSGFAQQITKAKIEDIGK
jgi:hypothetical protein